MVRFARAAFCFLLLLSFVGSWLQLGHTRYSDVRSRLIEAGVGQIHGAGLASSSIESPDNTPSVEKSSCHHRSHYPSIALGWIPVARISFYVDSCVGSSGSFYDDRVDSLLRPPSRLA